MGRFVASNTVSQGFSKAQVFTSSGSWTVPSGVNTAKVFVIGAGSCYRTTCMCFQGQGCYSGVNTPYCQYCINMVGHLPGAGGGYAEKTMTDLQPGATMTITVGSIGGASASIASIGTYTVTANNATEIAVNWNCTNNTTARNNSSDNPVSMGFQLPTCGYRNYISGYWNFGGTATGGDINRTGGRGVLVPYFLQDTMVDGCIATYGSGGTSTPVSCTNYQFTTSSYDYSFGGTRYTCTCVNEVLSPAFCPNANCGCCFSPSYGSSFNCLCTRTYHTTFGSNCVSSTWNNCICYYNCTCLWGTALCITASGGSVTYPYDLYMFAGESTRTAPNATGGDWGTNMSGIQTQSLPVGIGADSGTSSGDGDNAASEIQLYKNNTPTMCCVGGSGASNNFVCYQYWGCDAFDFVFGSRCGCTCWAHSDLRSSATACTLINCYNIGYQKNEALYKPVNPAGIIPLSTLQDNTGANMTDFKFGYGATTKPAGYGGGGNRLNPSGGPGAVVVIY